jgi:hypothetical protein
LFNRIHELVGVPRRAGDEGEGETGRAVCERRDAARAELIQHAITLSLGRWAKRIGQTKIKMERNFAFLYLLYECPYVATDMNNIFI